MKRFLQIASFCYVSFALLIATQSLATLEATASRNVAQRTVVEPTGPALFDHQRLDNSGAKADEERANYTIEVWTASWCGPCRRYKITQLPALLKTGCEVKVLDIDVDKKPKDVKAVPCVRVYYKGMFLRQENAWKASDVIDYIDNHLSLKG